MFKLKNKTDDEIVRLATYASVGTALIVIVAKIIGWLITDSLTIMASLIDSLLDIAASTINLIAVRYSLQPPDAKHRFGHEKAEDLAVFSQSIFFGCSAAFLMINAIKRIIEPKAIQETGMGLIIMSFSLIITVLLISFQHYTVKRTQSTIIAADKLHYLTDLLSNGATLLALYLGELFATDYIDPLFAIAISLFIFRSSLELLKKAFRNLMDEEFDEEQRAQIIKIIKSNPKVIEFHDLKTRYSGNKPFIQFHLELDPKITLIEAHKIVSQLEKSLLKHMDNAELMIRLDPAGVACHPKHYLD
jgi:ferrous-iron efflux pump FieF